MVYLLKMVIFHGELLNNQMVKCALKWENHPQMGEFPLPCLNRHFGLGRAIRVMWHARHAPKLPSKTLAKSCSISLTFPQIAKKRKKLFQSNV